MRAYTQTEHYQEFRALTHLAATDAGQRALAQRYITLVDHAQVRPEEGPDASALCGHAIALAFMAGYDLRPGPTRTTRVLVHRDHPDQDAWPLDTSAPFATTVAEIVRATVSMELERCVIDCGRYRLGTVHMILREATTFCILRHLGGHYSRGAVVLALAGVDAAIEDWSGRVGELCSDLLGALEAGRVRSWS